jgi:hypothetical protein
MLFFQLSINVRQDSPAFETIRLDHLMKMMPIPNHNIHFYSNKIINLLFLNNLLRVNMKYCLSDTSTCSRENTLDHSYT